MASVIVHLVVELYALYLGIGSRRKAEKSFRPPPLMEIRGLGYNPAHDSSAAPARRPTAGAGVRTVLLGKLRNRIDTRADAAAYRVTPNA
jgi:hypothetical protein